MMALFLRNTLRKFYISKKFVLILFLIFCFFSEYKGQTSYSIGSATQSPNVAPGTPVGSYALSGFESVNPYSGKVNFSLPLLKVGGRGRAGFTISLNLQTNWTVKHNVYDPNTYLPGSETYFIQHSYQAFDNGTKTFNMSPGHMEERKAGTNRNGIYLCNQMPCFDETLTRLAFVTPDGSEIEFRDVLYGGRPFVYSIYNGYPYSRSRGTHWVSVDGTNATFISDNNISDFRLKDGASSDPYYPSGTLYFADGTKYIIQSGSVQTIIDKDGNKTTLNFPNIKDSLGREIGFSNGGITYKGNGGATRNIKLNYASLESRLVSGQQIETLHDLFPTLYMTGNPANYNPSVISNVELPDGRKYEFNYNGYGELAEITLPTGGRIEYVWQTASGLYEYIGDEQSGNTYQFYRRVEKRSVYDGNSLESETVYGAFSTADNSVTVKNYLNANGTLQLSNETKHYFNGVPIPFYSGFLQGPTDDPTFAEGRELKTEIYNSQGTLLRKSENLWEAGTPLAANPNTQINPRLKQVTETLSDANLVTKKVFDFDSFNNITNTYEYDYGTGAPGALKRRTHTDYVTDTNYTSHTGAHLRGLTSAVQVYGYQNGQEVLVSQNESFYDETALTPRNSVVGWSDPQRVQRGNVTRSRNWLHSPGETDSWLETKAEYDVLGNVIKTIDAKNNASTIYYTDRFGSPDGEAQSNTAPSQLNGQNTFAFPTSATNAMNWIMGFTQYDYFTGQPVNAEDINGVISKMLYNDALDRPTQTVTAVGTDFERQSNVIYDDANHRIEVKGDLNALNDNLLKSESFYDGLGRTIETRKYENGGGYIATKSIPFAVIQDSETSIWRAATKVSNPYRPLLNEQPIWTTSLSDELGRAIKTITPDNAVVKTAYSGNIVTVTDQAGKQRRSITNALGQIIRVDEPDTTGNLGSVSSPVQPTDYEYNTLGKMIEVTQGVQQRHFLYDSLGRLLRVRQPEQQVNSALNLANPEGNNTQWTVGFSYDANGNVLTTTDAKNVTSTSIYDALNRVTQRSYNDSVTPTVNYTFDDTAVPFSKGKLTKVSSAISETRYTVYDMMGRLTASEQRTPFGAETVAQAVRRTSEYTYNLAGILTEQTYPSGRVTKNILESDGDLAAISSRVINGDFKTYASNFAYTASGVIEHLQIGNGLWESGKVNSRNQAIEIKLGTSLTDGSLWKLNYDYGEFDAYGNVDAAKNAGNIVKQTIGFNGSTQFVQTYKYDSLDRITEAKEMSGSSQTWIQNFGYDRYGNRTAFSQNVLGQQMPTNNQTLPTVDANTNKFQTGQGYTYDANGNLTNDFSGRQFTFDGDNKQTVVKDSLDNPIGQYYYDGNGKRVKKVTNTETVIFVYDGADKLVAEYSTATPVQNPTVNYTATDPLGSPRVITNKQGQIVSRRDFMPFGEELPTDATYRTTNLKYGAADNVRQKFTSYLRDEETQLDFAEARYYNNFHGRFTAVDPLLASGKSGNPQTFNRYVYTMNRPLIHIDLTGLQTTQTTEIYKPNIPVPKPNFVIQIGNCSDSKCKNLTDVREASTDATRIFNDVVQAIHQNNVNSINAELKAEAGPTTTEVTLTTSIEKGISVGTEGSSAEAKSKEERTIKSTQTDSEAIAKSTEAANSAVVQSARTELAGVDIKMPDGSTAKATEAVMADGRTFADQLLDNAENKAKKLTEDYMHNQPYPRTRAGAYLLSGKDSPVDRVRKN